MSAVFFTENIPGKIKKIFSILLVFVIVFVFNINTAHAISSTNVNSLSSPQGTNGWSGGYLSTSANSDIGNSNPASFSTTNMTWNGSSCWQGNQAYATPFACKTSAHPGVDNVSTAWKYVVPPGASGNAKINLTTTTLNIGQTSIAIWINNVKSVGYVNNAQNIPVTISKTQVLNAGDVIIFELNSRGGPDYDATQVNEMSIIAFPDAPTNLVSTAGDLQTNLSWNTPADNGSPIIDYVIEYKPHNDSVWAQFGHAPSTATSIVVGGVLLNGTEYDFKVSAVNSAGAGSASNIVSSSPSGIPSAPFIGVATASSTTASVYFTPLLNPTVAQWYNNNWTYRKKITIDKTKVPNTNQTNFPVLISLTGLSNINANGTDIRFTSSDGATELAREIESYSNGTLVAWVKVPTLSTSVNTEIFMYYGNTSATEPLASATYGKNNVWDNNFKGVWHMENPASPNDSTSNAKNLTNNNGSTATTGQINNAGAFASSSSQYLSGSSVGNMNTISYWVKSNTNDNGGIELNANQYIGDSAVPEGVVNPTVYVDGVLKTLYGSELLLNGGMEAPYTNGTALSWNPGATPSQETTIVHSGGSSQKIVSPGGWYDINQALNITDNIQYKGSGWMYVSSGAAIIALQEYYGSWTGYGNAAVSQTGSWKYVRFYSQADYTNPRFRIMDYNTPSTWYTDDLSFKQVLIRYPIADTSWHHVVITTATPVNTSDLKIGKGGARYMSGNIDEVKISSAVRSADWAKTEYNNQSNPSSFYAVASEENVANSASNGGGAVTVYTATSNPGNITATSTGSPIIVTGLTNGTEYTFTVTATNSAGTGPASSPSNPVTPATSPGSPTALTPTAGDRQVSLLWSAPASNGGSAITDYVIEYKLTSAPDQPLSWQIYSDPQTPTIVATVVSGLVNGTSYDFRISAVNAVGMGSSSSPLVSSIPKTIPGKTTVTSVVPGDTQATVNFDLLSNVTALNWYNNNWTYRKKITIDKTKVPNTNQTNFPVLISLTGLSNINANGTDIRFTSSDGATELAREIESYSNGTLVAWVKVPTLSTSVNTEIFMYYGNTSATEPLASTTYGSRSVWSNGYAGVWHLKESGTNPQVFDSTINAKNSTAQTWTPTTGKIGGGGNFSATSITIPGSPISNVSNDWTFSGWMKPSSLSQNGFIFMNGVGGVGFGIGSSVANDLNGNRLRGLYELSAWAISSYTFSDTTTWHYVQMRRASGVTQFFIDGVLVTGTWNINSANYNYADSKIGGIRAFSGALDEVTVSPIARSADWIKTEYNNQNNPSTFYSVATEETVTNSATNGGSEITNYTVTSNPESIIFSSGTSPIIVTGLTNGTPYTFTMIATNIVGQGPVSNVSSPVTPAGAPGIPIGVIATPGDSQVSLSWTAPNNNGAEITNYVIEYKLHSTSTWTQFGHAVSPATTITITDLVNGSLYDFRVSAINSTGTGSSSSPVTESTPRTVPGQPTITNVLRGDGQVTVSFDAPVSDGGSVITNYTIISDPQGIIQTGNTSPIIISGLTNGTPYTFTVKATNIAGDGLVSTSSDSITPATVPGKATGVIATAGNGQAIIDFTAPLSNGGSTITGYTVYSSNGGIDSNASSTNLSHTVTGLTNGQIYTFTVVAINDVGTGSSSDASLPITLPTAPTAPLNLATEVKSSSIKLTWSDPASTGGSAITDYIIEYQLTTGGNWVTFNDGVGIDKFTTVTGLSNDTSYDFRISAQNIIGTSTVSSVAVATPGEPAQVFIQSFPDLTNTSIGTNIRITNEGSTAYEYQYDWCITDAVDNLCGGGDDIFSASNAKLINNGDNYDFTATSTVPNPGNYYFHINVLYGSQSSSAHSSFSAVATFPDPPTGISAVAGNAQAVVSFTIPASNGGSAITNYTVTSNPGGVTGTGLTTPIIVTGLNNGTSYTFTMSATNIIGTGLSSSPSSNSVIPMTVPGIVNSLGASAGNSQVGLFWTAPSSNGGSAITDYVIEYKLSSDSNWSIFADPISTETNIIITGLTNDLSYDFRVSAVNTAGQGLIKSTSLALRESILPTTTPSTRGGNGIGSSYRVDASISSTSSKKDISPIDNKIIYTTEPDIKPIKNETPAINIENIYTETSSTTTTLNEAPIKNEISATPTKTSQITSPEKQKQNLEDNSEKDEKSNISQIWIIISSIIVCSSMFIIFILRYLRM